MRRSQTLACLAIVLGGTAAFVTLRKADQTTRGTASSSPRTEAKETASEPAISTLDAATLHPSTTPAASAPTSDIVASLRASSFGDVCAALSLTDEEVVAVAEIFGSAREAVQDAMARSARVETLDPAAVLLITKLGEAESSSLEKSFRDRLQQYLGDSRVEKLFDEHADIVADRLDDFGRTERQYVFEGDGVSLASSAEIRHQIEYQRRDQFSAFGVHQGGSYAGVDAFRKAFGPLAERALIGR